MDPQAAPANRRSWLIQFGQLQITSAYISIDTLTAAPSTCAMAAPAAKRMKGATAYMLFSEEQRPDVMARLRAEAPDGKVAVTVVAKAIGELWKGLSDSDKTSYKEKAQQRAIGTQPRLFGQLPQAMQPHSLLHNKSGGLCRQSLLAVNHTTNTRNKDSRSVLTLT